MSYYSDGERKAASYSNRIDELEAECDRLRTLVAEARTAVEKIVVTSGVDAGVVLLSSESPTHYDAAHKCHVYDYENFSPLGDALVALANILGPDLARDLAEPEDTKNA